MASKTYPKSTLASIFGDAIVYRNLEPLDNRIPGLTEIGPHIGLKPGHIPRKAKDPAYVQVLLHFLAHLHAQKGGLSLERLIYLGNRQSRDQATLRHFGEASDLPLLSFLCEEDLEHGAETASRNGQLLANRWEGIMDFARLIQRRPFPLNAGTAAIVDMDKTIIAARGRNAEPLNRSRIEGVKLTVQDLLGESFDEPRFQAAYGELNLPRYHFFTEDNQDYVAYAALMVSALVYPMNDLLEELAFGQLSDFSQFLQLTGERLAQHHSKTLWSVYQEVATYYARGDPSVFKSFRSKQFESTLARIDFLPPDTDEKVLLEQEIVLTREVLDFTQLLKERDVTLLLISDRPDESLIPSAELVAQGFQPVHRLPIKVVGTPLYDRLVRFGLPG